MAKPHLILWIVKSLHKLYRLLLSPWIGQQCRFHPRCSDYAVEAVERHGLFWGSALSAHRIVRCNPYCRTWGEDPVPEKIHIKRFFCKRG